VWGARGDWERFVGVVAVHREPNAIEDCDRWLEHEEVQAGCWLRAVVVCRRIGCVMEWVVQRVEIAAYGDRRPGGVGGAVVAGRA